MEIVTRVFDARLAAHVQVETTHGASNPSQLGANHQRNNAVRFSTVADFMSMKCQDDAGAPMRHKGLLDDASRRL